MDSGLEFEAIEAYPSPKDLTDVSQIKKTLAIVNSCEASISFGLSELLKDRQPFVNARERALRVIPIVEDVQLDAKALSDKVAAIAGTASRVGERVKMLEEEMKRIKESMDRVWHVMELKSSLQLLREAMAAGDYDAATRHCSRAMAIPKKVISGRFAETVVVRVILTWLPIVDFDAHF
jgi:hypothetical protein